MAYYDDWYSSIPQMTKYTTNVIPKIQDNYNSYQQNYQQEQPKTKRSFLNRFFDAMQGLQYFSMNYLDDQIGAIKQGKISGFIDPTRFYRAQRDATKAANPFGEGAEEYAKSFGHVLTTAGWEPTSKSGKFVKGVVSLAGDIALDPLTLVSGGVGGVVKGTGKVVATSAAKGAAKGATRRTVKEFSREASEQYIIKSKAKLGIKDYKPSPEEITDLTRRLNRLRGIAQRDSTLKLSTRNIPFSKKLGIPNISVELASDKAVRAFGDKTIAPYFNAFMHKAKLGKPGLALFPKQKLYKILDENPERVAQDFLFDDYIKSLNLSKAQRNTFVKNFFQKSFSEFTAAEQKQMTDYLEGIALKNIEVKQTVPITFFDKIKNLLQDTLKNEKEALKLAQSKVDDTEAALNKRGRVYEVGTETIGGKTYQIVADNSPINLKTELQDDALDSLLRSGKINVETYDLLRQRIKEIGMDFEKVYSFNLVKFLDDGVKSGRITAEEVTDILKKRTVDTDWKREFYRINNPIMSDEIFKELRKAGKITQRDYATLMYKYNLLKREQIELTLSKIGAKGKPASTISDISDTIRHEPGDAGAIVPRDEQLLYGYHKSDNSTDFIRADEKARMDILDSPSSGNYSDIEELKFRYFEDVDGVWKPDVAFNEKIKQDHLRLTKERAEIHTDMLTKSSAFHKSLSENLKVLKSMPDQNHPKVIEGYKKIEQLKKTFENWTKNRQKRLAEINRELKEITIQPKENVLDIVDPHATKYHGVKRASEKAENVQNIVTHHGNKTDEINSIVKEKDSIINDLAEEKSSINKRMEKIAKIENALKSEEAMEVLATELYGKEFVEQTRKTVDIMFDTKLTREQQIVKLADEIKKTFNEMIQEEKALGVVFKGEELENYVAHILYPELIDEAMRTTSGRDALSRIFGGLGKKFPGFTLKRYYASGRILNLNYKHSVRLADSLASFPTDKKDEILRLLDDFIATTDKNHWTKFDKIFKPHFANLKQYNKFKNIIQTVPMLRDGSVLEINKMFKKYYGYKNDFFVHSLGDAYLSRAIRHNEIVYDKQFSDGIIKMFGSKNLDSGEPIITTIYEIKKVLTNVKQREKFLKSLGFNELSGDLSQPIIKLTDDQIVKIKKFNQHNKKNKKAGINLSTLDDLMINKVNKAGKVQSAVNETALSKFLEKYDKVQNLWKTITTVVLPGFHIRNKYSNNFQVYLAYGVEGLSPKMNKDAYKVFKAIKNGEKITGELITDAGEKISYEQIYEWAIREGTIDGGVFTKDIDLNEIKTLGNINIPSKFDPLNIKTFKPYKLGRKIGSYTENFDRFIAFSIGIKKGKTPMEAAEYVNKYLFDYSDLTDFEISTMKRMFPFYTWMRKNIPLQLEEMAYNPKRYAFIPKIYDAIEGQVNEEDRVPISQRADFAKDWIQIPGTEINKYGQKQPLFWNPNIPYMDFGRLSFNEIVSMSSPIMKTPIELLFNEHMYFGNKIDRGYKVDSPGWIPGKHKMSPKVKHVLDQITALKQYGELFSKKDGELDRHVLNLFGGTKIASYNQNTYRKRMIDEYNRQNKAF